MKIDCNKDYYAILGVDKEATIGQITLAYRKWIKRNWDNATPEEKEKFQKVYESVIEAKNVLTNPENKIKYDEARNNEQKRKVDEITRNIEKQQREEDLKRKQEQARRQKVTKQEELDDKEELDEEQEEDNAYKAGRRWAKVATASALAAIIIFTAAAVSRCSAESSLNKPVLVTETTSETTEEETESVSESTVEETTEEETEEIEEETIYTEEDIYKQILTIRESQENFAVSIQSVEDVYDLLKWTHKNTNMYNGEYSLSNNDGYSKIKELCANNNFCVENLYQNTDLYDNIKPLCVALRNIDSSNDTLQDEYDAYQALNNTITYADQEDALTTATIMALVDYNINEHNPSMTCACGVAEGSGIGMTSTTPDYQAGNTDYATLQSTLTNDQQKECYNIYELVDYNSETYKFTKGLEKINTEDAAMTR